MFSWRSSCRVSGRIRIDPLILLWVTFCRLVGRHITHVKEDGGHGWRRELKIITLWKPSLCNSKTIYPHFIHRLLWKVDIEVEKSFKKFSVAPFLLGETENLTGNFQFPVIISSQLSKIWVLNQYNIKGLYIQKFGCNVRNAIKYFPTWSGTESTEYEISSWAIGQNISFFIL